MRHLGWAHLVLTKRITHFAGSIHRERRNLTPDQETGTYTELSKRKIGSFSKEVCGQDHVWVYTSPEGVCIPLAARTRARAGRSRRRKKNLMRPMILMCFFLMHACMYLLGCLFVSFYLALIIMCLPVFCLFAPVFLNIGPGSLWIVIVDDTSAGPPPSSPSSSSHYPNTHSFSKITRIIHMRYTTA